MGLREIIISVLLMAGVVFAFTAFLDDTSTTYGADYDNTSWGDKYIAKDNITAISSSQSDLIEKTASETSEFEPFAKGVGGTFGLVSKTKNIFGQMLNSFFNEQSLGFDPIYLILIGGVFSVIILFTIISALWRYRT